MSKLVLIDDEPVFHKIVQMTIKNTELSKEATYSFDGEVILDYLEEKKLESQSLPDYIFVDCTCPCLMDGIFSTGFNNYINL